MLPYLVVPLISATVPLISTRVLAHCQAILLINLTWVALRCRLSTVILPSMWHRSLAGSVALPSDMQDSVLLRLLEPRLLTWKITPWWRHQMETFSVLLALCGGGGGGGGGGIHRSPVNSPHKGQWRGAMMFYLICAWTNGSVNTRDAGDLRRHRAHYDVTVMQFDLVITSSVFSKTLAIDTQ